MAVRTVSILVECLILLTCFALRLSPPEAAEVFAPGIVSTGKEFGLTFTPDGNEAYFTRFVAAEKKHHIFETVWKDGQWQPATKISFSEEPYSDLDPFISPDGKRLFFVSTRPAPGSPANMQARNMDIWMAERDGKRWAPPHWIENINSDHKEGSPTVARDGTLYFFSDREALPNVNSIYASRLVRGSYEKPVRLPSQVNSGASDTSPFISPDGATLLFYSTRPGGYGGADLYVSFRRHGRWTEALNLGPNVNTVESEYNPSASPDGQTLFWGRNGNIYFLPISSLHLKQLKPKLFKAQEASARWPPIQ
ncbi:MAG TPA: hypothetical protein VNV88_12555 [Candidatus Solibacter sp.]|jgi:Tol biopolymer transport system component|nr:hypothetical protein [Candidatus Solibacter sp.]